VLRAILEAGVHERRKGLLVVCAHKGRPARRPSGQWLGKEAGKARTHRPAAGRKLCQSKTKLNKRGRAGRPGSRRRCKLMVLHVAGPSYELTGKAMRLSRGTLSTPPQGL
jgi:hypothetical protein